MSVIIDDKHVAFDASSYFLTPKCWRSFRRFAALAWNPTNSPWQLQENIACDASKSRNFPPRWVQKRHANAPTSLVSFCTVWFGDSREESTNNRVLNVSTRRRVLRIYSLKCHKKKSLIVSLCEKLASRNRSNLENSSYSFATTRDTLFLTFNAIECSRLPLSERNSRAIELWTIHRYNPRYLSKKFFLEEVSDLLFSIWKFSQTKQKKKKKKKMKKKYLWSLVFSVKTKNRIKTG